MATCIIINTNYIVMWYQKFNYVIYMTYKSSPCCVCMRKALIASFLCARWQRNISPALDRLQPCSSRWLACSIDPFPLFSNSGCSSALLPTYVAMIRLNNISMSYQLNIVVTHQYYIFATHESWPNRGVVLLFVGDFFLYGISHICSPTFCTVWRYKHVF